MPYKVGTFLPIFLTNEKQSGCFLLLGLGKQMDVRETDDPCCYLLAIWSPGWHFVVSTFLLHHPNFTLLGGQEEKGDLLRHD